MSKNHERLAERLTQILMKLNRGERLSVTALAEEFKTSTRTIQRDLKDRFACLPWQELGPVYYALEASYLGRFHLDDIRRFAMFASVQRLFPKIDQHFFEDNLMKSIEVRGFNYEDITHKQAEFRLINQAINQQKQLRFDYQKAKQKNVQEYVVSPYKMLNNNGIWYVMAVHQEKLKAFAFTRIVSVTKLAYGFLPEDEIHERISNSDSIYLETYLNEIVIKVDQTVADYFKRRVLLPNQEIIKELDNGALLLACRNVHEREVMPIVLYWLPYLRIISPDGLQQQLEQQLQAYLG